jgi:hypothetical protein
LEEVEQGSVISRSDVGMEMEGQGSPRGGGAARAYSGPALGLCWVKSVLGAALDG